MAPRVRNRFASIYWIARLHPYSPHVVEIRIHCMANTFFSFFFVSFRRCYSTHFLNPVSEPVFPSMCYERERRRRVAVQYTWLSFGGVLHEWLEVGWRAKSTVLVVGVFIHRRYLETDAFSPCYVIAHCEDCERNIKKIYTHSHSAECGGKSSGGRAARRRLRCTC